MEIYRISVKNPELSILPPLHFQEQAAAEAMMRTLDEITTVKMDWICEVVKVYSADEALEESMKALSDND